VILKGIHQESTAYQAGTTYIPKSESASMVIKNYLDEPANSAVPMPGPFF
jgi:hypothetical protein